MRATNSQSLGRQGDIRRALIEADLVDCMVALPGQLFYSTQIPVCLWFLVKSKAARMIKFVGDEISPSRVPIRELVELLRDLDRGLLEISEEEAENEGAELSHLALERLEGGSLTLTISDPTSPGLLEDLAGKVAHRLINFRPRSASNPRVIDTLLGFNHRHRCSTQIFRRYADVEPLVEFTEAAPPSTADLIEETTSFFGVLERVGGAEPRAWLRLDHGDRVICRLPADRVLAQHLAQHLYREVGLSGRAIRDTRNGELVELFVEEMTYVETPVTESFQRLERALGPYWSDVDVMSVIREERGEYGR